MKTLIIGASGTIGSAIYKELKTDTVIVTANHTSGDFQVDLSDAKSIENLFKKTGTLDAIVCAASRGVVLKSVSEMTIDNYIESIQQKMLGQIQVALQGLKVLNPGGSITLTTGAFNRDFVKNGSAAAMVNNAVEGFVKAAALDMPRGIRINAISPGLLDESATAYASLCPGFDTVPGSKVAKAYRRSIYGILNGHVFCIN